VADVAYGIRSFSPSLDRASAAAAAAAPRAHKTRSGPVKKLLQQRWGRRRRRGRGTTALAGRTAAGPYRSSPLDAAVTVDRRAANRRAGRRPPADTSPAVNASSSRRCGVDYSDGRATVVYSTRRRRPSRQLAATAAAAADASERTATWMWDLGRQTSVSGVLITTRPPQLHTASAAGIYSVRQKHTHTHTHTHIYRPFVRDYPGEPVPESTVKPIWILLEQETVSGSGISWAICKSAPRSRQITMPASHRSFFYRPDALHAAQPTR